MYPRVVRTGLSVIILFTMLSGIQTLAVTPAAAAVATCAQGGPCAVGDVGPGGGKVFYTSVATFNCGENFTQLCNYLEAAPKTWAGGAADYQYLWEIGSQQSVNVFNITDELVPNNSAAAIGLGYRNSTNIVSFGGSGTSTAAGAARAYRGGSKSDWYLPNNAEMNLLCQWARGVIPNVSTVCSGGSGNPDFVTRDYWTSSEYSESIAWRTSMNTGNQATAQKNLTDAYYAVRPVRAFARSCAGGGTCIVGDTGPGGGTVFFVAPTIFACGPTLTLTCKYLEGASQYWNTYFPEPAMVWSTVTTGSISAGGTAIGTGFRNTLAIISQGTGTSPAGERVRAYQGAGPVPVSDWYMASIDEIEAMFQSVGSISFFSNGYTSSSEAWDSAFNRYNIWYFTKSGGGNKSSFPKVSSGSPVSVVVKPVRAFSATELTYTPRTIAFDESTLSTSYLITDTAPSLVANISAGTGVATFASSTTAVCTINSSSGVVTFVSAGNCTITASVTPDSSFAAATTSRTFQISKILSTLGATFSTPTATYRLPITVTLSSNIAGKISLRANGKAINGCINMVIATSKSCTFKPSSHGQVALQIIFIPTNTATYLSTSSPIFTIPVNKRTTLR
jgi:hypothetical protein